MSWSVSIVGSTAKVADSLTATSGRLEGQSKVEFDSALPFLVGIVGENFESGREATVKLVANGHGYAADGEQKQRYLAVSLERYYGDIV